MARETAAAKKARLAAEAATANEYSLAKIVDASQTNGFLYTPVTVHTPMIAEGLVEVNPEMTDADGRIATRATQKGIDLVNSNANSNTSTPAETNAAPAVASAAAPAAKPTFQIAKGIAVPAIQRGGGGRVAGHTIYPFEQMEVNDSFFVANSTDKPNAAKSLASTVSSANARYAVEVKNEDGSVKTRTNRKGKTVAETTQVREFVIRARTAEQEQSAGFPAVAGARIWRVL